MEQTDIKSMTLPELEDAIIHMGVQKFRARQIYQWMHKKMAASYDDMNNVPKDLRQKLSEQYPLVTAEAVKVQVSALDKTAKYLFRLPDGNLIESVLMRYHYGNSVCISSQAGCRMGCRFCASTLGGLARNLTASEMLEQIYRIQSDTGERVDNVVVMGSGEPLDNYDNLMRFLALVNDENGLNIGARSITVSTCGIVPKIYELADRKLQITLAISLHAPEEALRKELMPGAAQYSIAKLIEACRYYIDKTGRRITFEYSLIDGVNDTIECAAQLGKLVKSMNCHINLIAVNPIRERRYRQSQKAHIDAFKNELEKYTGNVTMRREMGRDIDGACGQLRRSFIEKQEV